MDTSKALLLEKSAGNPIKYFPNTGNAGDSLINTGFYHLAEKLNLHYELVNKNELSKISEKDTIVIGGGGALVPEWNSTPEFIEKAINICGKVIILPQSIREIDSLLKKLRPQDVIFCREDKSHQNCMSANPKCRVYIDHDMAFHVDVAKLMTQKGSPDGWGAKNIIRHLIVVYHKLIRSKISKKIMAFRCDKESNTTLVVPRKKINDFSAIARFGSGDPKHAFYSAKKFIELMSLYDSIYTDRLHVVIGCSLINKEVYALPNNYYKIQGVIEKSLKNNKKVSLIQKL